MSKLMLTYFDSAASRGEECRLALFAAGVPFTDDRIKRGDWESRKAATPYGAVPVLTGEGHPPIAQSNAILRLIGSLHGLHPSDAWEAARHEAVMGAVEDLRSRLGTTRHLKGDELQRGREDFAGGYMQEWGGHIEAQLRGPFVGGAELQVADLKLYVAMAAFTKGSIEHIPADVFKAFPKLMQHHEAVAKHPKIVAWYQR